MAETMYEVSTKWGHFRLDEGAYRDYLQGRLWISSSPCDKSNAVRHHVRTNELPPDVSQKALELKNQAASDGILPTLQSLYPGLETPLPYKAYMADTGIEELNLSVRASNGLMRAGVKTFGRLKDLMETEQGIYGIRNLGSKSAREISAAFITATYLRLSNGEKAAYWQRIIDKAD